jgi:predicted dehydrogenase
MSPIGWAIIGTGSAARSFAAALKSARGARLVAILSRDEGRARRFAAVAGDGGASGVASLDALLSTPGIDIVYIATPNHLHAGQAVACLEAGKAVLCEKPLAVSAQEVRAIIAAAETSGRFCMEGLWTLCLPALAQLRRLVAEGQIGRITQITGAVSYPSPDSGHRDLAAEMGGGSLCDLGVYPLAVAVSLLGPPLEAKAVLRLGPSGADIQAAMAMMWEGATAALSSGFAAEGPNELTITGEAGTLRLHGPLPMPALVSVTPRPALKVAAAEAGDGPLAAAGLSRLAAIRQMLRPFRPGRTRLHPAPYRGNGLIHEIDEAMACLRAGQRESGIVPLSLSLAVAETLERLRAG